MPRKTEHVIPKGLHNKIYRDEYAEDKSEQVRGLLRGLLENEKKIGLTIYGRIGSPINDEDDVTNMMVATLLNYSTEKTREFVNQQRRTRHLEPIIIDRRITYEFRHAYKETLDAGYIEVAKFIGTVYPYADKIKRIGFLNEIIERLGSSLAELEYPDEFTLKKINLMLKASDRIDSEMGKTSMKEFLTPKQQKALPTVSKEEALKQLEARHTALPEEVSKIEEAVVISNTNEPKHIQ